MAVLVILAIKIREPVKFGAIFRECIEMKVKIEQLKTHSDMRGIVFEPIEKESIFTQENCHLVISEPGVIRGNHYHLNGTETIAVLGPAFLRFKEENDIYDFEVPAKQVYKFIIPPKVNDIYDFEVPAKQVYKFIIPPKVTHAIKNISEKVNILIAFNTLAHDTQNPDVINDILI